MLHLLCIPAGGSASELFFEKAMEQEYSQSLLVTSSKILVQKARMQGVNAVNFDYLANDILRQCGRLRVRQVSRKEQELIVESILKALQEKGKLPYFEKLLAKNGFLRSVTSLMDQLGSCGALPEEIAIAFNHWDGRPAEYRQKDRETAEIYGEYIRYLISHDVYDVAGLYRLAAEELEKSLKSGNRLKWETLFIMGFYQFDALQLSMIRSLSRCCDVWVALPYEAGRPELYGVTEFTYGELMELAVQVPVPPLCNRRNASLQHIVKSLRSQEVRPVPADGGIEIWQTDDRMGEMRAVLRDIKTLLRAQKVKPEEVAVVVRRLDDYSGIRALCDEYGIPVQLSGNASLTANPVFRYIVSLLSSAALYGREKAECWIAFLTQPLQRIVLGLPAEAVEKLTRARYYTDYKKLLEDVLFETRCQFLQQLWDDSERMQPEASVQEYSEQILGILSAMGLPEKAGQLYKDGQLTLTEFKNIVCAWDALTSLLQSLPQDYLLCGLENKKIPCAQFVAALEEAAEKVSLVLQPENQEGIAVVSAVNLEDAVYQQVYVMGLRENEFPYLKNENWIYNDSERADLAALGIALPSSADGYREDIRFFANACAAARERLVLTCFTDEEQNASPYIAEIQSLFTNLPVQIKKVPVNVEESLSLDELKLALARTGQTVFLQELMPGAAEAGISDWKRIRNEINWNGNLAESELLKKTGQQIGNRFSASKLETYRGCPFRFLVSYVWQQQSPEEAEEDMNPMQRGNLLHKVLEKFIRNHLGETLQTVRQEELQTELDSIFTETCQEFAEQGRLYAGDFWQHDKELQRLLLHRWLRSEIVYSETGELRPVCTEKEFGRRDAGLVPLDINGRRILLNGKIDRIDKAGNAYFITDYKSSNAPKKAAFLDTDLQLPLYILATDRILNVQGNIQTNKAVASQEGNTVAAQEGRNVSVQAGTGVIGGGYYVLKDGERKESFLFANAESPVLPWKTYSEFVNEQGNRTAVTDIHVLQEKTEQVLAEILEGMEQGNFMPAPSPGCDTFCPAAKICRWRILLPDTDEEESHA